MGDFGALSRIVLSMSLVLLLLCFVSLTAVKPGTGPYVVVVLSVWLNIILSGCIILVSVWRKMRDAKRRRLEEAQEPDGK
ncbi:hypothetical protein [Paenibacillus sp. Y412MC10]|uniref:hypothetical protein n=1 Tax=Geobacillus sp. (strain Y412MC10) TaxID=481743 RepID=UPI0011AB5EA3|nr:hypothetical protein [Paenibacillus sp. Y412MC10]